MPRKVPAKKSQPTASKKKTSRVKASSKNRPAKPKRSAPASKSKSSDSIDALVKKQLTALKQADTLFKDASIDRRDLPQKAPGTRAVYSFGRIYTARNQSARRFQRRLEFTLPIPYRGC
jgi:hypothetical protein